MAKKNTLLAILELDCAPDTLIDRAAWIARLFAYKVHLVLFEPDGGALVSGFAISSEADHIRQEIRGLQAEMVDIEPDLYRLRRRKDADELARLY